MRSIRRIVLTAVVCAAAVAAFAAEPDADKPKPLDGKALFKTNCKVCHDTKAAAGEYTPMTLIQEQWEEFFTGPYAEVHGQVAAPAAADKPEQAALKVTDVIDEATLEAIRKFCVDHAADSEQPMTCG